MCDYLGGIDIRAESLTGKKLVEDQNLSKLQDQLGGQVGGVFGKGGIGHGLGAGLSKNL
jgi:hypothetical protein